MLAQSAKRWTRWWLLATNPDAGKNQRVEHRQKKAIEEHAESICQPRRKIMSTRNAAPEQLAKRQLVVYGAAFNPPHLGHFDAVRQLLDHFEQVLVVPSFSHAFGKQMARFEDRLAMTQKLFQHEDPQRVIVSDLERALNHGGTVYTYDVLVQVQQLFGFAAPFAVGPDNAIPEVWQRFRRHADIEKDFGLVVVEAKTPVRSTLVRNRIAEGCVTFDKLAQWVGPEVAGYILDHSIYPVATL